MSETLHCRACFKIVHSKAKKSSKLKDKVKNNVVTFAEVLSGCTGLFLDNNSIEKEIICLLCKQKLIGFLKFKQKVLDTDKRFKELNESKLCEVKHELKLEEVKMEVGVLTSEIPIDVGSDEKENKNDVVQKESIKVAKRKPRTKESKILKKAQSEIRKRQRKENLEKYKRNDEGLYECPRENCPGLFKYLGRMEIHLEDKHPDTDQKVFPCETCGEEFLTFILHKRHVFKFHTPRPYMCDICGNGYACFNSIRNHMLVHAQVKKRVQPKRTCMICGKLFVNEASMLRHRKQVHFPKELIPKPFTCSVCGSQWEKQNQLTHHMKYHDNPDYKCDICSMTFSVKGILSVHMRTHISSRPLFCDICGLTYKTKHNLRLHQMTHKEERTFKCSMCPASFKMPTTLRVHEIHVHTQTDPVSCDVCGKVFRKRSSLKSHMIHHMGKDLKCPHCDVTYKDKGSLNFHVRTIHLGFRKRHACPFCMLNLSSRLQVVKHLMEMHQSDLIASNKQPEELVHCYWTTDPSGADLGEKAPLLKFSNS